MSRHLARRWYAIGLLILMAFTLGSCSLALQVTLFNNTMTDIVVWTGDETSVVAEPGGSAEFILAPTQQIDFGQTAHVYESREVYGAGSTYGFLKNRIKVQAEPDGRIYLVPPATTQPVSTLPPQPSGFPLVPGKIVDLT